MTVTLWWHIGNYWKHSYSYREIRNSYYITKLITDIPNSTSDLCVICKRQFRDIYVNACCNCSSTKNLQNLWWDFIIEKFPVEIFIELYSYDEQIYQILLGRRLVTDTMIDTENFTKLCHVHVIQCIAKYNRALRASPLCAGTWLSVGQSSCLAKLIIYHYSKYAVYLTIY